MRTWLVATAISLASATSALAADLPSLAPPPVFSWTGFYVGGDVGYAWGRSQSTVVTDFPSSTSYPKGTVFAQNQENGVIGGLEGGFNWQWNQIVLGVEGDYSWSGADGSETTRSPVFATVTETTTTRFKDVGTATGRLGFAINNWLLYVKGGGAWANFTSDSNVYTGAALSAATSANVGRSGWTIGGGVEWSFWNNWSAKVEYDYMDFGRANVTVNGLSGVIAGQSALRSNVSSVDVVKVGLNYRFNLGS